MTVKSYVHKKVVRDPADYYVRLWSQLDGQWTACIFSKAKGGAAPEVTLAKTPTFLGSCQAAHKWLKGEK